MMWFIASLLFVQGLSQQGYYHVYPMYDGGYSPTTTVSTVYLGPQQWSSSASGLPWYGSGIQRREDQDPTEVSLRDDWSSGYDQVAPRQNPGEAAAALSTVGQGYSSTASITMVDPNGASNYYNNYYSSTPSNAGYSGESTDTVSTQPDGGSVVGTVANIASDSNVGPTIAVTESDKTLTPPHIADYSSFRAGGSAGKQTRAVSANTSKPEVPAKASQSKTNSTETTGSSSTTSSSSSVTGGSSASQSGASMGVNNSTQSTPPKDKGSKVARRSHSDSTQVSHGFNFGYLKVIPLYPEQKEPMYKPVHNSASVNKDCLQLQSQEKRRNCINSARSKAKRVVNHTPTHPSNPKMSKYHDDVCSRRGSDCSSCLQDLHCAYCPADHTCYSKSLVGAALFDGGVCHHQSPKYFKMCSYDSNHVIYVITSLVLIFVLMTAVIVGLSINLYSLKKKGRTFDYFDLN